MKLNRITWWRPVNVTPSDAHSAPVLVEANRRWSLLINQVQTWFVAFPDRGDAQSLVSSTNLIDSVANLFRERWSHRPPGNKSTGKQPLTRFRIDDTLQLLRILERFWNGRHADGEHYWSGLGSRSKPKLWTSPCSACERNHPDFDPVSSLLQRVEPKSTKPKPISW